MALNSDTSHISIEDLARCKRSAQKEGLYAGLTSGLIGGLIGGRFLGFARNKTVFCGILTGVLSGYFFTQAFLSSRLAELEAQQSLLTSTTTRQEPVWPGASHSPNDQQSRSGARTS